MFKICTTIEQSKKLIELGIDVNTADMIHNIFGVSYVRHDTPIDKYHTPAWSLSALIKMLPDKISIDNETYYLSFDKKSIAFRGPITWDGQKSKSFEMDDILDAAFEMICWLKENKIPQGSGILDGEGNVIGHPVKRQYSKSCNAPQSASTGIYFPNLEWIDAEKELPIIDDNHKEGEIPYLGIYCDYLDYDEENKDFPFMDIVYFYGTRSGLSFKEGWKNSRWEKVIVKYWMKIPEPPMNYE